MEVTSPSDKAKLHVVPQVPAAVWTEFPLSSDGTVAIGAGAASSVDEPVTEDKESNEASKQDGQNEHAPEPHGPHHTRHGHHSLPW